MIHLLEHGQIISSPGCHFSYRVIGACCRLFDREQLPYPCCRLQWRGKEPSWRRIGKRFVLDMATRGRPTYSVEILEQGGDRRFTTQKSTEPLLLTLYWIKMPQPMNEWWYSDRVRHREALPIAPPLPIQELATPLTNSGFAEDKMTDG
ncbi:MAG: hypothetical protein NW224_10785 [Leptolyngbyaceae cyanobacterium bins.302]|nr:hypothetical protein [Leptolyngbyaceae cyanobacterium bins.302]